MIAEHEDRIRIGELTVTREKGGLVSVYDRITGESVVMREDAFVAMLRLAMETR